MNHRQKGQGQIWKGGKRGKRTFLKKEEKEGDSQPRNQRTKRFFRGRGEKPFFISREEHPAGRQEEKKKIYFLPSLKEERQGGITPRKLIGGSPCIGKGEEKKRGHVFAVHFHLKKKKKRDQQNTRDSRERLGGWLGIQRVMAF